MTNEYRIVIPFKDAESCIMAWIELHNEISYAMLLEIREKKEND